MAIIEQQVVAMRQASKASAADSDHISDRRSLRRNAGG
jgi:hypothetical protein